MYAYTESLGNLSTIAFSFGRVGVPKPKKNFFLWLLLVGAPIHFSGDTYEYISVAQCCIVGIDTLHHFEFV